MSLAASFGRSSFARFINTTAGRIVRIVAGLALIAWGYTLRDSITGIILIVLGIIPLVAGTFNLCLISAALGGPINGSLVGKGTPPS